jgi:hypothetical protein
MTWVISVSEEEGYYGDYPTREEAIAAGFQEFGEPPFYVGKSRPPAPLSSGIDAEQIIDYAIECPLEEDWCLEFAHFEPTDEQVAELTQQLRVVVDAWVKRHGLEPKWFVVDNIERIEEQA